MVAIDALPNTNGRLMNARQNTETKRQLLAELRKFLAFMQHQTCLVSCPNWGLEETGRRLPLGASRPGGRVRLPNDRRCRGLATTACSQPGHSARRGAAARSCDALTSAGSSDTPAGSPSIIPIRV